jgi:hypothetical protein
VEDDMRRTLTYITAAGVLVAGLGLAAQQKPAPAAAGSGKPSVTVYKSPT